MGVGRESSHVPERGCHSDVIRSSVPWIRTCTSAATIHSAMLSVIAIDLPRRYTTLPVMPGFATLPTTPAQLVPVLIDHVLCDRGNNCRRYANDQSRLAAEYLMISAYSGEVSRAEALAEEAVSRYATHPLASAHVGSKLHAIGQLQDAKGHFQHSRIESPLNPWPNYYLGRILVDEKKWAAAREHLDTWIRNRHSWTTYPSVVLRTTVCR